MTARRIALGLAGLLAIAILGCNEIVGIKGATEDPASGSGGGSSDGSGGTSGVSCNPDLEVSTERAVGCLFRIACDPFLPPYSMSECVGMAWQDSAAAETCTYGATSCEDIDACIGRRYEPEAVCEGETGWSCDESGERAIHCTPDGGYSVDCELFGGTCLPHSSTVVQTAFACQPNSPPTCPDDAAEGAFFCEGTQRFTCIDGEPRGVDCAAISSDCIEYGPGEAYCSDRTESCSELGLVVCDGNSIQACDSNGYRVQFDCSTSDLGCGEDSETDNIECLAAGCDTTTDCEEACLDDQKTMRFCSGGVAFVMDCTEYGFDGCLEGDIKDGVPLAYCAIAGGADPHP